MKTAIFTLATLFFFVGCGSSPAERQIEAQAEQIEANAQMTVEKAATVAEYKECVMDSKGDEAKLRMCEALLKVLDSNKAESMNTSQ